MDYAAGKGKADGGLATRGKANVISTAREHEENFQGLKLLRKSGTEGPS